MLSLCLALTAALPPPTDNVLLIIADDVGVDRIAAYAEHADAGPTPTIDLLAQFGVFFRNAYSDPVCSPTRANMLTGRYGPRTGIGIGMPHFNPIGHPNGTYSLSLDELLLPEVIRDERGFHAVAVGKWHLTHVEVPDWLDTPALFGFEEYRGAMCNLNLGAGQSYFGWDKNVVTAEGNSQTFVTNYATSENVDDALALIDGFGNEPWFMWLAFNAPHKPFHVPPEHLHGFEGLTDTSPDPLLHRAMLEAMDTEVGRLLVSMRPSVLGRTWIIFVGDNGTPGTASTFPSGPGKDTVFEGGINVPLIIAGPGIATPGVEVDALANTVDVFATVLDLMGVPHPGTAQDSVSLLPYLRHAEAPPQRAWTYSTRFMPNGFGPYTSWKRGLRDERYKLIVRGAGANPNHTFFDLETDPFEEDDLLSGTLTPEQQAAFDKLSAARLSVER